MTRETTPKIEIEDLQPKATLAGYRAIWQEGGLIAYAYLEPIDDQPNRGFILEYSYRTVSGREPGPRQIDAGTTLTSKVREYMIGHMVQAGWRQAGRAPTGRTIWQHQSRLDIHREPAPTDTQDAIFTLDTYAIAPGQSFPPQYAAKAVQEDVQATVTLFVTTNQPGWYRVDRLYERSNGTPGALGRKQKPRALALLTALEARVQSALQAAGWAKQGELWHPPALINSEEHSQAEQAQTGTNLQQKVLHIPASTTSAAYQRTITQRDVTLTCARCGSETTRAAYPGATPQYCDTCAAEIRREKTRARVTRLRTARREAQSRM